MNPDNHPRFPDEEDEAATAPEPLRVWTPKAVSTLMGFCLGGAFGGMLTGALAAALLALRGFPFVVAGAVLGVILAVIAGVEEVRRQFGKGIRTADEDLPTGPPPSAPASLPLARCLRGHRRVVAVAVSPDGRFALTAGADGAVLLWDLQTGSEPRRLSVPSRRNVSLAVSPDGRLLAVEGPRWMDACQVSILDAATGSELRRVEFSDSPFTLAFLPHSPHLLIGDYSGLRLWDIDGPRPVSIIKLPKRTELAVSALAVSCDGRFALAGCASGAIYLASLERCEVVLRFAGHTNALAGYSVLGVGFAQDSMRAVSAGQDGTARVWSAVTGEEHRRFSGHRGGWLRHGVVGAAWLPGGRVVSAGRDGSLCVWEADTGAELRRFDHGAKVSCLAVTPDGRLALTGGTDGLVRVWEMPAADAPRTSRDRITTGPPAEDAAITNRKE